MSACYSTLEYELRVPEEYTEIRLETVEEMSGMVAWDGMGDETRFEKGDLLACPPGIQRYPDTTL
jgi:hypothetical protein